jgi:hypothetical protein
MQQCAATCTIPKDFKCSESWFAAFSRRVAEQGTPLIRKRIHSRSSVGPTRFQYEKWLADWQAIIDIGLNDDGEGDDAYTSVDEKEAYIRTRIFNTDESAINRHNPKHIRVLVPKGSDAPLAITKAQTWDHVTIMGTICANGDALPIVFILASENMTLTPSVCERMGATPSSTTYLISKSGYQVKDTWLQYIQWLYATVKPTPTRRDPIILIVDGAPSHLCHHAVKWGLEHNVHIFMMLPNATATCQPLDVGLFGPMKRSLYKKCNELIANGKVVDKVSVMPLIIDAYAAAFTKKNILAAWNACAMGSFGSRPDTRGMTSEKFAPPRTLRHPIGLQQPSPPISSSSTALVATSSSLSLSTSTSSSNSESKLPLQSIGDILQPRVMHQQTGMFFQRTHTHSTIASPYTPMSITHNTHTLNIDTTRVI